MEFKNTFFQPVVKPPDQELDVKTIPDEVWLKIFGFLSTGTILRKISRVCKHFWKLSQDSILISNLHLSVHDTKRSVLKKKKGREAAINKISCCKFLKKLTIDDGNFYGDDGNFYGVIMSNFKADKMELDVIMAGTFLCAAIKSCSNIRYLKLQNINYLDKVSIDQLASQVDIYEGVDVSLMNTNSKYLVAITNKFHKLEHLCIKDQLRDLSPEAVDHLITKRKNSLKSLLFYGGFTLNGSHLQKLNMLDDTLEEFAINCAYQLGKSQNSLVLDIILISSMEVFMIYKSFHRP